MDSIPRTSLAFFLMLSMLVFDDVDERICRCWCSQTFVVDLFVLVIVIVVVMVMPTMLVVVMRLNHNTAYSSNAHRVHCAKCEVDLHLGALQRSRCHHHWHW
jgi:hypothetical protein